eukprot:CAMPEP_0198555286 /NCGR_PEP_ID=MMETSP1462-20131121/84415_1 /TAXON_ID=1333877 /ORGANISM="Brandtodinium nutriculum, Strain RCC3387" /LENGTH=204 /DNA_ID=CAMNT_0044286011 /DNA_START=286 /DNA_END=896 /DNA_ORIENTATION=+
MLFALLHADRHVLVPDKLLLVLVDDRHPPEPRDVGAVLEVVLPPRLLEVLVHRVHPSRILGARPAAAHVDQAAPRPALPADSHGLPVGVLLGVLPPDRRPRPHARGLVELSYGERFLVGLGDEGRVTLTLLAPPNAIQQTRRPSGQALLLALEVPLRRVVHALQRGEGLPHLVQLLAGVPGDVGVADPDFLAEGLLHLAALGVR